ncbi:putative quinol monooxygenase [Massilia sp. W12]|uniref:putative quinol monooxygenase n=1 Tax=Massilia sp. W12 TaxID=3126507 RepID=UPI0030CF5031
MTVHVVARIIARPGAQDALKQILQSLLEPSRQDAGCLSYHLHVNKENPCEFVMLEEWRDDVAIDAHFGTPHIQSALARTQGLLAAAPEILRYQRLG